MNTMKQNVNTSLLILVLALWVIPSWGQSRDTIQIDRKGKKIQLEVIEEETDTVPKKKITVGWNPKDKKKEKAFDPWKTRWFLIDLGFASYLYDGDQPSVSFPDSDLERPINPMEQRIWRSWNVNINLFQTRLSLYKNYLSLTSGLGFEYYQYGMENEVQIQARTRDVEFAYTGIDYDANRLRSWYMTVPMMLNMETNPKRTSRSFRIGVGGFVGLRLSTTLRQKWDIYDNRTRNNFNFNQFRYGFAGQIGYGPVTLYGNLAVNGMFDAGNTDEFNLMPLNVGIRVIPF